jgi:NTP pyrophosphatase (non-canonical NTP hydrolase)
MNWYQEAIKQFAIYPGAGKGGFEEVNYLVLGLTSEAGEVAGKWKKFIRDGKLDKGSFVDEVGDVLWYLTQLASSAGISLEELAQANYDKLSKRKQTNTLGGSGDNREKALVINVTD